MKWIYLIPFLAFFVSCSSQNSEENIGGSSVKPKSNQESSALSKEERLERHIRSSLDISNTEKYDYDITEEDCNGDGLKDWVVTVNLLDRAMNNAIQSGKVAHRAATGFMGYYNHVIFVDGASEFMSPPLVIPSSPKAKLGVSFDYITSDVKKDIMIDSRVMNAGYRDFLSIHNNRPIRTLQVKRFDGVGSENPEAYHIELLPGSFSLARDIHVYKGTFDNPTFDDPDDVYSFVPEIVGTNQLERKWFYGESMRKYFTEKDMNTR